MFFREHHSSTHPLPLEQHSRVQGVGATAHFGFRLAETSIDPGFSVMPCPIERRQIWNVAFLLGSLPLGKG